MRAIRNSEMAKALNACKHLIDAGMNAVCIDSVWDGDKLKPGEQNDNIRARAAELREAIKVMLGNDKATRGKGRDEAPPNECDSCALQVYCVRFGRTEWPHNIPCPHRREDNPGWPKKIFCGECREHNTPDTACHDFPEQAGDAADPCCYIHATPPDPYGGKVLADGMIEYVSSTGENIILDPQNKLDGFGRGDIITYDSPNGNTHVIVGVESGRPVYWVKNKSVGIKNFFVGSGYARFGISRAPRPQETRIGDSVTVWGYFET